MSSHVVMELPGRADETVFVPDRFVLTAFIAPVLWLAWHRLWVEALAALAAGLALGAVGSFHDGPVALLGLLVGAYVGLEGSALRIAALERRGYRQAGIIEAANVAEAELRYLAAQRYDRAPSPAPRGPAPARVPGGEAPMFGLIDLAGGR